MNASTTALAPRGKICAVRTVPQAALALAPAAAQIQAQNSTQNAANTRLTPKDTLDPHSSDVPEPFGLDGRRANRLLFRGVIPFEALAPGPCSRFLLPVAPAPQGPSGDETGLGDLAIPDIRPFQTGGMEFGLGPLLLRTMASDNSRGAGPWQAGLVGPAIAAQPSGGPGARVTWQTFAGNGGLPTLTMQPPIPPQPPRRLGHAPHSHPARGDDPMPAGRGPGPVIPAGSGPAVSRFKSRKPPSGATASARRKGRSSPG